MKALLILPSAAPTAWMNEFLPEMNPAELPIAGKRAIDYILEEAAAKGYDMAEILDYRPSKRLEESFSDISTLPLPVFYIKGTGEIPSSEEELKRVSSHLTQNLDSGETKVVWGLELGGIKIDSPQAWHKVNFIVLGDSALYTLPCYSAEKGIYLGRNVVIERGAEIKPPALLCDNTWLARSVRLEGGVIIGSGSYIGEATKLENTIVAPDTCIGESLEFVDKAVVGSRIIDPESNAYINVTEKGLARSIGGTFLKALKGLWRAIVGHTHGGRG